MDSDKKTAANAPPCNGTAPKLVLRLYITRGAANSLAALANLKAICDEHYLDRYTLEVVDILMDPRRAFVDGILLTPTLVKLAPPPHVRIAGDLSQTEKVLLALGPLEESRPR